MFALAAGGGAALRARNPAGHACSWQVHQSRHSQCLPWLQVVGLPFGPANLVLGLPKDSPLTPLLNNAILQLRNNGVIDQLKRRWVDDLDQCTSTASQVSIICVTGI